MKTTLLLCVSAIIALLVGCTDASIASHNLSKASDYFEVTRRIVFLNGITDSTPLEIIGRCSIQEDRVTGSQLEVTCKTGPDAYRKHYLGLSDNMTYFVEQLEDRDVSVYHYRVEFKPQSIIPDAALRLSLRDIPAGVPVPQINRDGSG